MGDIPLSTWGTAALVFLGVALGTMSLAFLFEWLGERRRQRDVLGQLRKFEEGLVNAGVEGTGILRRAASQSRFMADLSASVPTLADLHFMLQQAGMSWTVGTFLTITLGTSVGLGLVSFMVFRNLILSILMVIIGAILPYAYVRRRRTRRMNAFEANLPEAIDLLGRAIRAGHPLSSGMKMVADEMQEPISGEFQRTFEEHRFGVPFEDAIQELSDRVDIVDVRILVTAILIQREVGGNLAEVLDNLASVIRARFTIRRQLRVYTAQGRISGYVLAALPIVVGTIIYLLNPDYGIVMFTHSLGRFFLGGALIMQLIGFLWIRKIINIDI